MDSGPENTEDGVWQSLLSLWGTVVQWENGAKERCHGAKTSGDLNLPSFHRFLNFLQHCFVVEGVHCSSWRHKVVIDYPSDIEMLWKTKRTATV